MTKLLEDRNIRCDFCNDESALILFGENGKGIGKNCIKVIREICDKRCGRDYREINQPKENRNEEGVRKQDNAE